MDSNEEYLDQLLRSLTEGSSSAEKGSDDSDEGIEHLLNQFSDDMNNVPGDLLSGLFGGSDSTPETLSSEESGEPDSISEGIMDEEPDDLNSMPQEISDEVSGILDGIAEEISAEEPEDLGGIAEEILAEEPEELGGIAEEVSVEEPEDLGGIAEEISVEEPEELGGISEDMSDEAPVDLESLLRDMSNEEPEDSDEEEPLFGLSENEFASYETSDLDEGADDLGSLLESLGAEGDEDVKEISDLLTKAEHDEPIVDMMDSTSQEIDEEAEEQPKGRKKKKKERVKKEKKHWWGRKKQEKQEIQDIADSLPEEFVDNEDGISKVERHEMDAILAMDALQGQKKQGFWGKLLNALTQEEEEPEDPAALVSDENGAILEELDKEEKNKAKGKKKKAEKKGKGNKGKKSANVDEDEELDEEASDNKKKKKEKKPKKEKPAVSVEELLPGRKLPIQKVLSIVLVTLAFCVAYVLISHLYIGHVNKQQAEKAYYAGDYLECYRLLFGQDLNESQALMYHKSEINLQMERTKANYQRLVREGKDLEALDYLVQFICRKEEFYQKGQEWGCLDVVEDTYSGMTSLMIANYGLSGERAIEIAALKSDVDYTVALMKVLEEFHGAGTAGAGTADGETGGQDQQSSLADLLPEEEENSDTTFVDSIE